MKDLPPEKGIILDLLTMKGHMRWLQRSSNTNPTIWENWEERFHGFVLHYVIDGWEERVGKKYGDQPRLAPCETCKKKCKTPAVPPDFYLISGSHLDSSVDMRMGSFDDEYSPLRNLYKHEEEKSRTNWLLTP